MSGSILRRLKFKMVKDIQRGVNINWILLKLVCYCPCRLETYERNDVNGPGVTGGGWNQGEVGGEGGGGGGRVENTINEYAGRFA